MAWVYGLNNFCTDIEFMLGQRCGWYWTACWGFIIPVGLLAILIYAMATRGEVKSGDVAFPPIATGKDDKNTKC